jgi:hypothetical protein
LDVLQSIKKSLLDKNTLKSSWDNNKDLYKRALDAFEEDFVSLSDEKNTYKAEKDLVQQLK